MASYCRWPFFLGCYLVLGLFVASRPARRARRDGAVPHEALGFNTRSYKLPRTGSPAIANLAGALYAYFSFFVTPTCSAGSSRAGHS